MIYRLLADLLVGFHAGYVLFIVVGLLAIWVGRALGWKWIHNRTFRSVHFLMIAFVAFEAVIGMDCPLTDWEISLRELAGQEISNVSFVGRLFRTIFLELPEWAFNAMHIGFALLVLATFWVAPVRWRAIEQPVPGPSQAPKPEEAVALVKSSSRRVPRKTTEREEVPAAK